MKPLALAFAATLAASLAATAQADTRSSDQEKTTMEQKASPSNPVKQDEERTEAHSQPDTPHAGGTSSRNTTQPAKKAKSKTAKEKGKKPSASAGSSAADGVDLAEAFKRADIDGDGAVSKAEAAGNARLVSGFDRADRNHDGKLSQKEFAAAYRSGSPSTARAAAR